MKNIDPHTYDRNWFRVSLVHIRSRLIAAFAYLSLVMLLGMISLLLDRHWPGSGIWVWVYMIICVTAAFGNVLLSPLSIQKAFSAHEVEIAAPENKGLYRLIQRLTHSSKPHVRAHFGEDDAFIGAISTGLPYSPVHIIISGIAQYKMNARQLKAMLAHEFGHLHNGNPLLLNIIRMLTIGPMIIGILLGEITPWGKTITRKWPRLAALHQYGSWAFAPITVPLSLVCFYGGYIMTRILYSPVHYFEEYGADANAYMTQGTGRYLAEVLDKMYSATDGTSWMLPNWFIITRLTHKNIIYNYIAWYPSLKKRIRTLLWLEQNYSYPSSDTHESHTPNGGIGNDCHPEPRKVFR